MWSAFSPLLRSLASIAVGIVRSSLRFDGRYDHGDDFVTKLQSMLQHVGFQQMASTHVPSLCLTRRCHSNRQKPGVITAKSPAISFLNVCTDRAATPNNLPGDGATTRVIEPRLTVKPAQIVQKQRFLVEERSPQLMAFDGRRYGVFPRIKRMWLFRTSDCTVSLHHRRPSQLAPSCVKAYYSPACTGCDPASSSRRPG